MEGYPKRPPYYAHVCTRVLFKSCAAQSIGLDAVALVIHIAHTEDAARYQGPVSFWNSQLSEVLGFKSPKQLNAARQKAIDAGWLRYYRKNDRSDGKYWTVIPMHVQAFSDDPIEPVEPIPQSVPNTESIPNTEHDAERESYALRNGKVTHCGKPPIPTPIPKEERGSPDATNVACSPSREECLQVFEAWTAKMGQRCSATDARIVACKRRLKDKFFAANWNEAIDKISKSDFCKGQSERGWKATIDFLLAPSKFARIMDGEYDNKAKSTKPENKNLTSSELHARRLAALAAES